MEENRVTEKTKKLTKHYKDSLVKAEKTHDNGGQLVRDVSMPPRNRLMHMDCMEFMSGLPDKCIDLAIVDPPYGIGVNHNMGRRKGDKASEYKPATWDKVSPPQTYFDELFRVSKNQVIWGANHFIKKMPYNSPCWLMWDKKFSEDVTFAQFELAWTSFNTTTKKFEMFPNNEKRIHPTQKPVELYRWILRRYAKAGDLILDTHVGSGSSLVACIEAGYDFYGTEIDEDYYRAAQERISRATRVYELFEGAY